MRRQHEGRAITMMFRRLGRFSTLFLTVVVLLLLFRSPLVVVIPLVGNVTGNKSPPPPPKNVSRIAKATVATNTLNNSVIHQALRTHQVQNEIHGYIHHTTTEELVSDLSEHDKQGRPRGAWSKPAYLLGLIVAELTKPESERLEWIFWFDADTVVLNPHTPLEIFLPPDSIPQLANVNLLMASNWDGLNSGVFALRVHPWSVSILSTVLAYPIYQSARSNADRFRDQSAFQWLLQPNRDSPLFKDPVRGKDSWAEVPMRWFNSLPFNNAFSQKWDWIFNHNMTSELFDNGTEKVFDDGKGGSPKPWKVMRGDMVVHFAGANPVRDSWMGGWLERAEAYLPEWSNATKQVELKVEAQRFWEGVGRKISRERETARQLKLAADKAAAERAAAERAAKKAALQKAATQKKTPTDTKLAVNSAVKSSVITSHVQSTVQGTHGVSELLTDRRPL